jgi:hypothetical protein
MKKLQIVTIIFILFTLTACTGNISTPLMNNADDVATIVAATLSAIPFRYQQKLNSTQTVSPMGELLVLPPYLQKEQAQYFQLNSIQINGKLRMTLLKVYMGSKDLSNIF